MQGGSLATGGAVVFCLLMFERPVLCVPPKQTCAISPLSVFQFHALTLDYNISIKSADISSEEEVEEEEACLIEIRSVPTVLSSLMKQSPLFPVLLVWNKLEETTSALI